MSLIIEWHQTKQSKTFGATSLQGYVRTTYEELENIFGPPTYLSTHDKINAEWNILVDDHIPIKIYDYKNEFVPLDRYEWHIGGFGPHAVLFFNLIMEDVGSDMRAYDWRIDDAI